MKERIHWKSIREVANQTANHVLTTPIAAAAIVVPESVMEWTKAAFAVRGLIAIFVS